MRSFLVLISTLTLAGGLLVGPAAAQTPGQAPTPAGSGSEGDPEGDPAPTAEADAEPVEPVEPAEEEEVEPTERTESEPVEDAQGVELEPASPAPLPLPAAEPDLDVPSPGEMSDRLAMGMGEDYDGDDTWTAPTPVFTLHGYMRARGELMDTFWLGRPDHAVLEEVFKRDFGPDPFTRFRAFERRTTRSGSPVCIDEGTVTDSVNPGRATSSATDASSASRTYCEVDTIQFANMRLRLSPELNVTEDVRVRATFDALDNVVAGTRPIGTSTSATTFYGTPGSGLESTFADTVQPGSDSVVVRRAWAEVRNRDLGELRFGRMAQHWGLGLVYNSGNGLDQDFSTDLDRLLGMTKLAGFYLTASYDFISEGPLAPVMTSRPSIDGSQLDDVDQFSFSVSRRLSDEEQAAALERGELVFNTGLHFSLRNQDAVIVDVPESDRSDQNDLYELVPVNASRYTPDLWAQLLLPGVRIEAEFAMHFGSVRYNNEDDLDILSFGGALETEFRFLEDKLGLYFNTGLATGDADVEGLSANANFVDQLNDNDTVSTFAFHPSYQVDMILWRNIMRQVTGAYYFKPGVSYDFVRSPFGELLGARLDVIWSRASSFIQAPGNSPNLGVELNAAIYWRSEDGADPEDGYHASLQYGVLFPLAGLGLNSEYADVDLDTAQQLRLVLGVVF